VDGDFVEVPTQDLRAIRRAILDLGEFEQEQESQLDLGLRSLGSR
jgi:hypothetical protein